MFKFEEYDDKVNSWKTIPHVFGFSGNIRYAYTRHVFGQNFAMETPHIAAREIIIRQPGIDGHYRENEVTSGRWVQEGNWRIVEDRPGKPVSLEDAVRGIGALELV